MVNKRLVMFGAIMGMVIGGALPLLWSDEGLLDPMSILLGFVGGLVGIWLMVQLSKRLG